FENQADILSFLVLFGRTVGLFGCKGGGSLRYTVYTRIIQAGRFLRGYRTRSCWLSLVMSVMLFMEIHID
ncbi:MAG: hypothetical protein NC937_00080, partial [Candidatus Omnitrophica bacterium]|nr:hypothetical protein [Candidatus Omnitrophota bacterium]